jgi:hypothetical protein
MGERDAAVICGERHQHGVVQNEIESERERQRDEHGRCDDMVDDAGLQRMPERVEHAARDRDRDEGVNAQVNVGEVGDVRAQHDERAVQDIDDVEDTPHQRKAHGDARVEPAEDQTIRSDLEIDHTRALVTQDRGVCPGRSAA